MGAGAGSPGHDLCQGTPFALGLDPPPTTTCWGHHLCPHIRDEPDDATHQEEEADVDEATTIGADVGGAPWGRGVPPTLARMRGEEEEESGDRRAGR